MPELKLIHVSKHLIYPTQTIKLHRPPIIGLNLVDSKHRFGGHIPESNRIVIPAFLAPEKSNCNWLACNSLSTKNSGESSIWPTGRDYFDNSPPHHRGEWQWRNQYIFLLCMLCNAWMFGNGNSFSRCVENILRATLFRYIRVYDEFWIDTVYPKKYAHGFCFAVLCCGYTLTDFPISIRLTSLALWQSNDCPCASKATLMNMDKYFMWIHYERLHNHNKAKHNKTVCIFLGLYCTFSDNSDW